MKYIGVLLASLIGGATGLEAFIQQQDFQVGFYDIRRHDPAVQALVDSDLETTTYVNLSGYFQEIRAQDPRIQIDLSDQFLTPQSFRKKNGFLTAPRDGVAQDVALSEFVDLYQQALGFDREGLQTMQIIRDARSANGSWHPIFQQRWGNVPIFGALFKASLSVRSEVINLSSMALNLSHLVVEDFPSQMAAPSVEMTKVHLSQQVYFPLTAQKLIPAVEIYYDAPNDLRSYRGVFDAVSGNILFKQSVTDFELPPSAPTNEFYVFAESLTSLTGGESAFLFRPMDSPQPMTPGPSAPNYEGLNEPILSNQFVVEPWINPEASPQGWVSGMTLIGNNASVYRDWDGDHISDFPPIEANDGGGFSTAYNHALSPTSMENLKATHIHAFYTANWFHDRLFEAGFTEPFWNFQQDNFERGGLGGDGVEIITQFMTSDGMFNNALFSGIPIDGNWGRVKLSLFNFSTEYRDPAIDSVVLMHELTHGVTRRLIPLIGFQGDGMNEGWADVIALSLVGFESDDPDGNYPVGSYVSKTIFPIYGDAFYFGARRYPYSTNLNVNPLTLADMDPNLYAVDSSIPKNPLSYDIPYEPHNVGEIWAVMIWEVRAKLLQFLGFEEAQKRILKLFVESIKLAPLYPSFVQMRDALLEANQLTYGGELQCEIWKAFAKRGLGVEADVVSPPILTTVHAESFNLPEFCDFIFGDLNSDGSVSAEDIAILLGAWGGGDPSADLDGNGIVNALDLAMLLGAI